MKKIFLALFLMFFLCENVSAQALRARINRPQLPEGETFMLSLELEDADTSETPDLSVLDKDFTVYSVSNAYRTNITNGVMSRSYQWNLVLIPNRSGTLTIPSIKLGTYQSNPVKINVIPAGSAINAPDNQNPNQPRFKIEASVDNKTPYVQQQINYVLTIYDTGGLQGEEPVFVGNTNDEWIIKSLSEPQISTKIINGRNIREIKFYYALFPQKSGTLEIPSVRFNGFYLTKEKRHNPFDSLFSDDLFIAGFGMTDVFATRNPVVLMTEPMLVSVKPAALENNGKWWLPASEVSLAAEFNPPQPKFKVGEAVNRTIYLKASGVADTQLPEIRFADSDGLKQYPEKPETQMKVEGGRVVSLEKISNVYIPTKAGKLQLPPIAIDWFNVNTQKMEKALLPSMTIDVQPSLEAVSTTPQQATPQPQSIEPMPQPQAPLVKEQISQTHVLGMAGIAFILGLAVSWLLMKLFKSQSTDKIRNYKKYVIEKAQAKDLRAVRDGLLLWAADFYGQSDITSLREIEEINNVPEFGCELEKLSESLYADNQQEWKSGSFIKVFEMVCKQKKNKGKTNELLPKLYK